MRHFLLLTCLSTQIALGQADQPDATPELPGKSNFRSGLMSEAGLSVASTRMLSFRAFLRQNQIQPDSHIDPFIKVGVGYRYDRLKFMVHADYGLNFNASRLSSERKREPIVRQQQAVVGSVSIGYDVINSRNRRLFVNAGLGGLGYEYSIIRPSDQAVAFPAIFQSSFPGNIPSLKIQNNFWDINIELTEREKRKQSSQSVLRLGYRAGLRPQAWTSDAYVLTGGISDRISQVYFQTTYYFSSNHRPRQRL